MKACGVEKSIVIDMIRGSADTEPCALRAVPPFGVYEPLRAPVAQLTALTLRTPRLPSIEASQTPNQLPWLREPGAALLENEPVFNPDAA